jgi:hypothetical protein
MSTVNRVFVNHSTPNVAVVSGDFYDLKNAVEFRITIANISSDYTFDSFKVDIDLASKSTTIDSQNTITYAAQQIKKKFVSHGNDFIMDSIMTISDEGDIEYNFINHVNYKIQYAAVFKHVTTGILATVRYIQLFRYYETPITINSDFQIAPATGGTVSKGDNIIITGLDIASLTGGDVVVDHTEPIQFTLFFQDYDDEFGDVNNSIEYDEAETVRLDYDALSGGTYTILTNTLTNGKEYIMRVTADWASGYSSSTSSHAFTVINRPIISSIEALPLYDDADVDQDVITINLEALASDDYAPAKFWVLVKTIDGDLVATAGGVDGFSYNGNSYSFALTDFVVINDEYLESNTPYTVEVKAQYDGVSSSPLYGYSDPEPVTFDLTEPTISAIAVNDLYSRVIDGDEEIEIATITVSHEAYKLYAPHETDGIKFVFYNPSGAEVARTSAYDFVNAASGSTSYPIKLSEIIETSPFLNGITYTVKAAVKVTNHAGTTDYVVSSESSTVTFALTEPTISAIDVVKFYVNTNDTENNNTYEVIATINVSHEAYKLYAPSGASGIKFVFYTTNDIEVARTSAYTFANAASGSTQYPIKRNEILSGALVNGTTYRVKAAVKGTDPTNPNDYVVSSEYSTVTLAIIEPTISEFQIKSLFTDVDTEIATIKVNHASYSLYSGLGTNEVTFVFYTTDNLEVAKTSAYNFKDTTDNNELYSIKRSEFISGALVNGTTYKVKAAVNYTGMSTLWKSSGSVETIFDLIRPVINSVSAYDVQNDGGYNSANLSNDSDQQIVATVNVNHQAYKLYAPDATEGIKFVFYNADDVEVAKTSAYPFVNSDPSDLDSSDTSPYNIKLNDISLTNSASALTNGTPYKVKAEVKLVNHSSGVEYRLSQNFTDNVKFSQDIAPIASVTISNTWALNTNNDPSSSSERFVSSPLIGISGYFNKTAQFNVNKYSGKQLDVSTTKFRLEYKVGTGDWKLAKRAILNRALTATALGWNITQTELNAVSENSNGEYDNVVGTVIGTSQNMVFCIPQDQGTNNSSAFTENDTVKVKVTIVDTADLWKDGDNVASTDSNSLQLINRIKKYSEVSTNEPWNSSVPQPTYLDVTMNGSTVPGVTKALFKSSSNNIIEEVCEGWKIVNTAAGTNGAVAGNLPKAEIFLYANPTITSSNSFQVNQINGLGAYAIIDQHQGAKEYPFFNIYTNPTGTGDKAPGYYKSRLFYAPQPQFSGDTTTDSSRAGLTLLYTGNDDALFRPDITRRVEYVLLPNDENNDLTKTFGNYETELVKHIVLSTSSNASTSQAGNFNFTLSETGLTTSSLVLSSLVISFTKKLFLNIPVDWESVHAHSVKVGYKYSPTASYTYKTFPYQSTTPQHVSIIVDPNQGTTLYYSIAYIVNNENIGLGATTQGLTASTYIPNRYFPEDSDYTISYALYRTFNNDGVSNISFNLAFNVDPKNRLDGVNVYFTSSDSGIGKVRIGSYTNTIDNVEMKTIPLLSNSGAYLNTMNSSGIVGTGSALLWGNYDSANITFEAYRDARITSTEASYNSTNSALDPVASGYYVESGEQSTFGSPDLNPIWNVPVLTTPGSITLSGGVINIVAPSSNHYIQWTQDISESFTYDVKVTQGESTVSTVIVDDTNAAQGKNIPGNSCFIPIDLDDVDKYTVEIRKVFNGLDDMREVSDPVTVVFYTVKVDTSDMDITVQNPSNTQYVNLSWNEPVFSGTGSGELSSSFENNIFAHYIKYRTSNTGAYARLGSSDVERIVSPATKKHYDLPVQAIGTLYEFVMYVEAQVKYTVDGVVSASKSVAFQVPLTTTTTESKYRVSSIPSVGINIVPTLVQDSSNPVLNLVLNANGLEDEGFISVVIILTQDGRDSKPEGEQVFLVFPDTANSANSAFSFNNSVNTAISGSGSDPRLAGGDESTSAPRNISSTVLSTAPSNNTYVLKIGAVQSNGRYGLSTLAMPPTSVSGFVDDSVVNYMVILTSRRGTDIGVGEFIYKAIPLVQNVFIDSSGGDYYVNFTLTPA